MLTLLQSFCINPAPVVNLRPYQSDLISKTRALMLQGCKSILLQSPTGSGKTLLTAFMLKSCVERGQRAWFVVHRRELIKQSIRAFGQIELPYGVIAAGWWEDPKKPVQIASIQSLIRRHHKHAKPNLIVWDECHHLGAASWQRLHEQYPGAYHIGLTATPCRLDGKGLSGFFKEMLKGPSVASLIDDGYLSKYRLFAPPGVSTQGVHTQMGDYNKTELGALLDRPTITGDAIAHYQRLAPGKRAVVFAVSIAHSKHVVSQFQAAGIPAEHVDGETPTEVRDHAIKRFTDGNLKILSNVELFGEGFDVPNIEAAILLRPTQSIGLYLQQVGRAFRPAPGKDAAIILDHAGNCQRHGFPDEDRVWTLAGGVRSDRGDKTPAAGVRVCERCFAAQFSGTAVCRFCGYAFKVAPREVEEVAGTLQEIDPAVVRFNRAKEQASARDLAGLIALGKQRGYKNPAGWARYVWAARQAKREAVR